MNEQYQKAEKLHQILESILAAEEKQTASEVFRAKREDLVAEQPLFKELVDAEKTAFIQKRKGWLKQVPPGES